METLYTLDFGVTGKAANGLEYGGNLVLDNMPTASNGFLGEADGVAVTEADVFVSGAFGKIQLGDFRGASDLAVVTPTVGEGQVVGRYIDFLSSDSYAKGLVVGIDGTDHSTNITYYTPKVGNASHKVQLGVTYEPNVEESGSTVSTFDDQNAYENMIKGAIAYNGTFNALAVNASANLISANGSNLNVGAPGVRDYTAWGLGAEAAMNGITAGINYTNLGHYNTLTTENKEQQLFGAGVKYEINKVAVVVSYLGGEGYDTGLTNVGSTYVKKFNSYGIGGAYTWAPGLTTNVDGVLFGQKSDAGENNEGYVLLVSQKLAF